jgi:solute carrier family 13 (sodium-dependent dicarboxylate transporter), member 2/3/5
MAQTVVENPALFSQGRQYKEVIGIFAAILAAAIILLLPTPEGLSEVGKRTGAIFVAGLILWTTEAIPIAITALLVIILQPLMGVTETRQAFSTFMSPVFFFVIAMFCIAGSMIKTGVDQRFATWLLSKGGTGSGSVVFSFMVGTGAISMIMSDIPACAIWMALGLAILTRMDLQPGKTNFGKALMLGIPIASLIGGVATPAGSSINIIGIDFIERYGNIRISFLSWTLIGLPMVIVLIPIAWWVLMWFFPPEKGVSERLHEIRQMDGDLPPMSSSQKKTLILLSIMIVLWILSSWYPKQLDLTIIALAGAIAMFLPGINLLTWKEAEKVIGWDSVFIIGSVSSLGDSSNKSGLAKWMVDYMLGGLYGWDPFWIIMAISAFTVLIHLIMPIATVINAVFIPPIILLAQATGQNPALYALPVAFTASCSFLLPIDAVCLVTYSKGYYRMFDLLIPGLVISFFWVILMTLLMFFIGPWIGLF